MRILTTLLILLATVLPGLAATTYPAATNAPNIFFQTNTFLTNTYFGLDRTNVIGTAGSAINGVGLTNGNVTARNLNSVTNFDTRAWTNSSGDLYIGASPNSANLYFWNDGDNEYRHVYTAGGQFLSFDANLSVTGQVNFKGGTVSAPLLTSSSTSNAPSSLELASAGWVRSLFNNGVLAYATTNIDATATNVGSGQPMYTFASAIPSSNSRTYTAPNAGDYIGSVMSTNTFTFLQGPIEVNAYLAGAGGVGGPSIAVHPEIYYSYNKTNWLGDWDAQNQTVAIGSTNLYQFVVSFPAVTATNSAGFYIQRRFKVGTATGATHPNLIFLIGTNIASGTANASHISFSGPNSSYGNAYLANNQTWTGTNTFTGDTIFTAPVSFSQLNVETMIVTNGITASNVTVTGYFITPTNTPTDAYVLTATGTGGASAWKVASGGTTLSNISDSGTVALVAPSSTIVATNLSGTNYLGGTNFIGGPSITNPVIVVSNNTVQFRNATANGTNIFYVDPATGALLWNTDGKNNIGASGANRPYRIYTSGSISCGTGISIAADNNLLFDNRASIWGGSPTGAGGTAGTLHITHPFNAAGYFDRLMINGPVRQLSNSASNGLFSITCKTNAFAGGTIDYTIFCSDGTDQQTLSGIVTYAGVNTNGVWRTNMVEVAGQQALATTAPTATLTTAWLMSVSPTTNTAVNISVTPATSLTPAANQYYIMWQLRNNGTNVIAPF